MGAVFFVEAQGNTKLAYCVTSQNSWTLKYYRCGNPSTRNCHAVPTQWQEWKNCGNRTSFGLLSKEILTIPLTCVTFMDSLCWKPTKLPIFVQVVRFHDVAITHKWKNVRQVYQPWERRLETKARTPPTAHSTRFQLILTLVKRCWRVRGWNGNSAQWRARLINP